MNDNEYTKDDIRFWSNPSRIYYKIYLCYGDDGKRNGLYRLMEMDDWDEFHQVEILNNSSLEHILIVLDLLGCKDRLENLEDWEYALQP